MRMCSISGIINPIGALADKVGGPIGSLLDPAAAIGKKIGGPVGAAIDVAHTAEKMYSPQPAPAASSVQQRQVTALYNSSPNQPIYGNAFSSSSATGKTLLGT